MIRLLVFAFLIYLAWRVAKRLVRALGGGSPSLPREKTVRGEDMVRDPQCGLYLPRGDALERRIGGKTHYFCSKRCRDTFSPRR